MLGPKCKNMWLVSTYLNHEIIATLVVEYDEYIIFFLLLKAYKLLIPNWVQNLDEST